MTQEELLLQRVLDRPDDDTPRLAYADHLAQWGVPRGEFIRVELELARIDKDRDPNYLPLAERSYAMIDDHGPAFAGQIGGMVDQYSFDRGFVELVKLPARRFLEIAPQLYALAPIRHLDLTGSPKLIPELFASPYLKPIRSLNIRHWGLMDEDMQAIAASPHLQQLRWLSIADNLVGLPGAETLAASRNLPSLKYVVFSGNPVDPSEKHADDQGVIINSWMEEAGVLLEEKYGRIPWLHADPAPRSLSDVPPNRFII